MGLASFDWVGKRCDGLQRPCPWRTPCRRAYKCTRRLMHRCGEKETTGKKRHALRLHITQRDVELLDPQVGPLRQTASAGDSYHEEAAYPDGCSDVDGRVAWLLPRQLAAPRRSVQHLLSRRLDHRLSALRRRDVRARARLKTARRSPSVKRGTMRAALRRRVSHPSQRRPSQARSPCHPERGPSRRAAVPESPVQCSETPRPALLPLRFDPAWCPHLAGVVRKESAPMKSKVRSNCPGHLGRVILRRLHDAPHRTWRLHVAPTAAPGQSPATDAARAPTAKDYAILAPCSAKPSSVEHVCC